MSEPSYFEHEPTVQDWLTIAEENLRGFERSPLHERLRTKKRDTYTQFFEIPDKTLLVLEKLLEKADKKPAPELRLSNIKAPWGCWELGMQNNPATIRLKTDFDTGQEYVYRFVCSVVNAVLLNTEDLFDTSVTIALASAQTTYSLVLMNRIILMMKDGYILDKGQVVNGKV